MLLAVPMSGINPWKGYGVSFARRASAIAALSLLIFPAAAFAESTFVSLSVSDGTLLSVPLQVLDEEEGILGALGWTASNVGYNPNDPNDPANDWSMTLNIVLDPDPQIVYAMSVLDFGAPTTFGFIFQQVIAATGAPGLVSHSHSSSTTAGGGAIDTTPVTAVAPPGGIPVDVDGTPEIAVYTLSQNACATFINAQLDLSPSFVGAGPSAVQGPFNPPPIAGPAGAGSYNCMRVDVNFMMAGGNDAYTFNGIAEVVPEPGTAALLGLGLGGLAFLGRRRR